MFTIKSETHPYEIKTIRLRKDVIDHLDSLANQNNISFNKVVSQCIDYALSHMADSDSDTSSSDHE